MTKVRLSKRSVDALVCSPGRDRSFLWDDALSGFGVVAFPTGKKAFVAQYRQNGRSRRIVLGDFGRLTAEEARSKAKKLLGTVESGVDPIEERRASRAVRTVAELAREFMALHSAAKLKQRTTEEYNRMLNLHILPALRSRRLVDVRRADVARLHSKLKDSPYAANRCVALLSSVWNWAARRDETDASNNPTQGIEPFKEKSRERFLKVDEFNRLGDALRVAETTGFAWDVDETKPSSKHVPKLKRTTLADPYAVAAIRLLILTGARCREILDARWDYVDWERGMMFLPDSKTGVTLLARSA